MGIGMLTPVFVGLRWRLISNPDSIASKSVARDVESTAGAGFEQTWTLDNLPPP